MKQIEYKTREDISKIDYKVKAVELDYQHIVSELGEVCSWLT